MDQILRRILPKIGGIATVAGLAGLSGSDFTSVLLEVGRRRAARQTPASVLRRYTQDRFVCPSAVPWRSARLAEELFAGCLPPEVEVLNLAPVVPLGTHSALGTVSQDKVLTTIRPVEVAADATNGLALEAAARRTTQGSGIVRLAAFQRVLRAQRFGPGMSAHFGLFALVTAGRDEGGRRFEDTALAEQLRVAVDALTAGGLPRIQIALTPLSDAGERMATAFREVLAGAVLDRDRVAGRGYYRDLCFKVNVLTEQGWTEIGDGGFTDWTARLTGNQKERLLISGFGIDRLAVLIA
jgi:hypothetical protein